MISVRQAVFRAFGLIRRPLVALAFLALAVGGALLVRLPLLGQPGYELSAVLSVLHGLFGSFFGIAAARQERRLDPLNKGKIEIRRFRERLLRAASAKTEATHVPGQPAEIHACPFAAHPASVNRGTRSNKSL